MSGIGCFQCEAWWGNFGISKWLSPNSMSYYRIFGGGVHYKGKTQRGVKNPHTI